MKQICGLTIAILIFFTNPIISQDARITIPSGNSYVFSARNLSFNGNSITIGQNAGAALGFSNDDEIYIGNGAGEFIGGSVECIAIGLGAMSNGGAYRNIGIGTDALKFIDTYDNVAIGAYSQSNNQNGFANVSVGSYTMKSNIISNYNVAIGFHALNDNGITGQEANNNIGLGQYAQSNNRTGNRNISIGGFSLHDGLAVTDNVAIGHNSLNQGTGDKNVAIGTKALKKGTLANNSVVIGFEAGFNDTLASNSVLIGYQAGKGIAEHAKSGNVFIGYRAGADESGSNKLYIDNSNTSDPLIKGNFATDLLEVNGAFQVSENATFNGSRADFVHGNNSSSGVFLQNDDSNDYWRIYVSSSTGDLRLFNSANGGGTTMMGKFDLVTGAYTTPSDRRLKTDIHLVGSVLPALMSTSINSYKFKAQKSNQRSIGVMAQEVEVFFPELVHYDAPTDSYTVDYAGFSMVALKAIQEQQEIIETLMSRVEKLENEK